MTTIKTALTALLLGAALTGSAIAAGTSTGANGTNNGATGSVNGATGATNNNTGTTNGSLNGSNDTNSPAVYPNTNVQTNPNSPGGKGGTPQ
jgi:hypothetical protein